MLRMPYLLAPGIFALALTFSGFSAGHAWEDQNQPVPPFTLPSDSPAAQGTKQPYYFRTDPTGALMPNDANPNIPTEITGFTSDHFLTYDLGLGPKRIDTTGSACQYYLALGEEVTGVVDCGTGTNDGALIGGPDGVVTFEKWKKAVKIDKYAPKHETDVAHFVNQVDLNLTRDHHMISHSPDNLAAYVCNHSGPAKTVADPTGLFPPQPEIDRLIRSIKSKASLVACVAMEYSTRGQPSGTKPFTKFFIFGPDGNLLSTVDLDGRGPKGVPQVCTACHGGTFNFKTSTTTSNTQQFAIDPGSATPADLGAHFLPFDIANFAFSSDSIEQNREDAIFRLNRNVYNTEFTRSSSNLGSGNGSPASDSIVQLIQGWYGDVTANNTNPHLNRNYIPVAWKTFAPVAYANAVAHSCRTCHAAMDREAFELYPPAVSSIHDFVCGSYLMPNSKVTFDRFWLSDQPNVPGQPAAHNDQVFALEGLFGLPPNCSAPPQ